MSRAIIRAIQYFHEDDPMPKYAYCYNPPQKCGEIDLSRDTLLLNSLLSRLRGSLSQSELPPSPQNSLRISVNATVVARKRYQEASGARMFVSDTRLRYPVITTTMSRNPTSHLPPTSLTV